MCIGDVITNEALKLEVESLRKENAALKAVLAQQTTNKRDAILLLEECHRELKICKKWPLVPMDCMCLHCRVERFIAQNGTRL